MDFLNPLSDLLSAAFLGPVGPAVAALLTAAIVGPLAWLAGRHQALTAARHQLRRAVARALGQAEARTMNTLAPLRSENRQLRAELATVRERAAEDLQDLRSRHADEIARLERLRMNAIEDALRAHRAARAAGLHVPTAREERRQSRAFAPTTVGEGRAPARALQRVGVPAGTLLV
jgi:hypothetical protein